MDELLIQLGNYGFPMVVAAYLLVRVERKIDHLSMAIRDLERTISLIPGSRVLSSRPVLLEAGEGK